jgi:hypothetical protein
MMKQTTKKMRVWVMLASMIGGAMACGGGSQSPTSPSATSGDSRLVAFYPFTGNANDQSGSGANGTVQGAVLTTDRNGVANAAYEFSGAGEISAPFSLSSTSMTSAAWISIRKPQCWGGLVDAYPEQWEFVTDCATGDALEFAEWRSAASFFDRIGTQKLSMNRWTHVAVTVDGTVGQFYIDGAPSSSFALSGTMLRQPTRLFMGHSKSGTSQFLSGALDEVRIYNAALSASEIKSLYDSTR